jgi:hypothetical protein
VTIAEPSTVHLRFLRIKSNSLGFASRHIPSMPTLSNSKVLDLVFPSNAPISMKNTFL